MKIRVLVRGKLRKRYLEAAESEYRERLRPYCRLEVVEVKNDDALLAAIAPDDRVYALDERGDMVTSAELAAAMADEERAARRLVFTIGGPDGHSDGLRRRADRLIAFGRMTIAHRLVRVVLMEQIYRAFRINRGEPYHRD